MAQQIRFQYQVKVPLPMFSMNDRECYEVRELLHKCDPNKSDRENLDDAFCRACELGADPNKNVRWRFIDECAKTSCLFNNNGNCFTTRDEHHPYESCKIR